MLRLRRFLQKIRGESGQTLVELALLLPVLLLLLLGVVEFGRILMTYLMISHSSREGARLAAVGGSDSAVVQRVQDQAFLLDPDLLVIDINPSGSRTRGSSVTVTLDYDLDIFLPLPP
ncbi:MAG: TadE/TadG family type IV pilus assembly protein, partial [Syntrophomonadaceae bacterium]|nr:TadE/TadG family type IV pilus assembly protein [Syntrophomonadaceae bacterium]